MYLRRLHFLIALFACLGLVVFLAGCGAPSSEVQVRIETDLGTIHVAVDTIAAPVTAGNFLYYVDAGLYDGGSFFRSVRMDNQPADSIRIEVIQGGANPARSDGFLAPIELERTHTTGLNHLDGTISMARGGPDSARHSIFICIGDQPSLDFGGMRNPDGQGFAAFGRVIQGMDVVRAIQQAKVDGQSLIEPVTIVRAERLP